MKLYSVSDGPPTLLVRLTLKALDIPYEMIDVDFVKGEHMTEEYAKLNPQKEIPVLDDDGFVMGESIAIVQYLADKYRPDTPYYPKDPQQRALVLHHLLFNTCFYYPPISRWAMCPIFFDYPRDENGKKRVIYAMNVFETYLQRQGTKYAAADNITLADFGLIASTIYLTAVGFELNDWPAVKKWYETFKSEQTFLWELVDEFRNEMIRFEANYPDLSHMDHPLHPTRKN